MNLFIFFYLRDMSFKSYTVNLRLNPGVRYKKAPPQLNQIHSKDLGDVRIHFALILVKNQNTPHKHQTPTYAMLL